MSDVSVDIIKNRSGEAPDLPSGANLSGVSTAATLQVTNLNPTHINASGVTTATTFSGSFKSTSTPTLGLGVTINSSGINISGVATAGIVSATTLYGNGYNLTGVAFSIAPISYNPDVNDTLANRFGIGIAITFTERIIAGSGNVTLRIAGAAGTVVENFGVGSSVTIANNTVSFTPTANLAADTVYHISYPSGAFTNTGGDVSYVGTAYTFTSGALVPEIWVAGRNDYGELGQNDRTNRSSPVQIPGNTWSTAHISGGFFLGTKTDGTLWASGGNDAGYLGQNSRTYYSSPVQISGTTWNAAQAGNEFALATRTDGTLWAWGNHENGQTGLNLTFTPSYRSNSSPTQIPGTTWTSNITTGYQFAAAVKTNGTLWAWGSNTYGKLGQNNETKYSSPVQIPGTTWSKVAVSRDAVGAIKTDGTLWVWGVGLKGGLGQNNRTNYSSPVQIPGTWSEISGGWPQFHGGIKTNGELWAWGENEQGEFAQNDRTEYSSPVQVPGTWSKLGAGKNVMGGVKTDGTLWTWGMGNYGQLGLNTSDSGARYSSPVQVPGTSWVNLFNARDNNGTFVFFKDA